MGPKLGLGEVFLQAQQLKGMKLANEKRKEDMERQKRQDALNMQLQDALGDLGRAEAARALNGLARREVIDSPASPRFSVDLVRRWLAREKPLAWVREELQWSPPPVPGGKKAKRRLKRSRLLPPPAPLEEKQEAGRRWWAWVLSGVVLVILLALAGLNMRGCVAHEFLY